MLTKEEMPACPAATTVQLIGSKRKLLILRNLMQRPWRFNELRRDLEGISQKVLTDSLRSVSYTHLITLVKNTQVVWSRSTLVNPRAVFDDRNIGVHGITRQMVKESPTFAQIWQEYGRYFRHYSVVMHNAGFDASVLKKAAKRDGVSLPPMDIYCTMRLCEENYGFEHLSLSSICLLYTSRCV